MPRDRATDDAQDLFTRGHKAFSDGDFQEAVECFSRAIRLRPNVSDVYRFRAYAYLEMGDRVRALNDLDQAIRLKPDDARGYADRAAELYIQRQFDQAVADCDRALKLDPARADLLGLRGRCHADRGDSAAAFADFAAALAADGTRAAQYRLWRARLHLDLEDYAAAEADATAALTADPRNPEALVLRGGVRQQSGDFARAAADYSAALALKPDHPLALLSRAACRLAADDAAGAAADAGAFLALVPGAAKQEGGAGGFHLAKAHEIRGNARRTLGDLDGALADYDEAVKRAPGAALPHALRAGIHYARQQYGLALRDHMEALKRDPRSASAFNQLAWIWATCPDPDVRDGDRARECATRACELTEWGEPGFLDTLAAAYAECGEFDDAVKWQQKAIDLLTDPTRRADYRTRLELFRRGQPVRAAGGTE
jgi:serine/threonine-protein kinase